MKRVLSMTLILLAATLLLLSSCQGNRERTVQEKLDRARQWEESDQPEKAVTIYEEILTLTPCSDEAFFRLGIQDYYRRDFPWAEERFTNCVRCNREHHLCWERLAWSREKLSRHAEAAKAYHEANRIRPDREFMDGEARALLKAGKIDDAETIFLKIRETYPEDHRAVYFLANIRLRQGNKKEARELYEKAIEMRPVLVEAYQNLASILFEEGKYAEAAALMEKTFETVPMDAPYDADLRYNIAICYLQAGDRENAEKHFQQYLKLAPQGKQAETVKQHLKDLGEKPANGNAQETDSE